MAIEQRYIFCDESDTDGKPYFLIGGLECTPVRRDYVAKKIKLLKYENNINHELKWTGIGNNERYINIYKSLIDIFLKEKFLNFKIVKFNKNMDWKKWSKNEDERFYKCYYYFLQSYMSPYKRYNIYLDDKDVSRKYNRESLYWALTNSFKSKDPLLQYNNKKNVQILKSVCSRNEELIQLVDVLIKASFNDSTSHGKKEISSYFINNFNPKIIEWEFDITKTKEYKK